MTRMGAAPPLTAGRARSQASSRRRATSARTSASLVMRGRACEAARPLISPLARPWLFVLGARGRTPAERDRGDAGGREWEEEGTPDAISPAGENEGSLVGMEHSFVSFPSRLSCRWYLSYPSAREVRRRCRTGTGRITQPARATQTASERTGD